MLFRYLFAHGKVRSKSCSDKQSDCKCSLTLTCHEVAKQFQNLTNMNAQQIGKTAAKNKKGSVVSPAHTYSSSVFPYAN